MLYIENWDKIKERYKAFWRQETIDRCCVSIKAPKPGITFDHFNKTYRSDDKNDLLKYWTDPQCILDRYKYFYEHLYLGGEALTRIPVNLGPGITAAYFGCKVTLSTDTVWFSPFVNDWNTDSYNFDPDSEWWRITKNITRKLTEACKGEYLVCISDLSGVGDIMSHMRGAENLCIDLIKSPDSVKKARDYILSHWYDCYNELYETVKNTCEGSTHWLNLWAPGKHMNLQCDFCTMISPKMFEEFFLPEIQAQCRKIDYPLYHLDGPSEIKHLDLILSIPELKAIQWVPNPGYGDVREWMWLYKKIRAAGKSLYFEVSNWYGTGGKDIEYVLDEMSPDGLFIDVYCENMEEIL